MLRFVVHCGLPEGPWDQGQYLAVEGSCVDSGIRSGKGVTPSLQVVLVITPVLRDASSAYQQRTILGPKGQWPCLETFSVVTTGKVFLVLSGRRPGLLLNSTECTGQPSMAKSYPA